MRVYRIVFENPPTEQDFYSRARLGKPRYSFESDRDYHMGISVYDDLEYIIGKVKKNRGRLGWFVAALDLPDIGIAVAKTTSDPHHYDLYEPPDRLLKLVTRVYSIREVGS